MKKEYIAYASRLNTIGNLIIEISNLIGQNVENNTLGIAIDRYKYAHQSLSVVKAPEIITEEHENLVNVLGKWIEVTDNLTVTTNPTTFKKLIESQEQEKIKIGIITKEIGDKLVD